MWHSAERDARLQQLMGQLHDAERHSESTRHELDELSAALTSAEESRDSLRLELQAAKRRLQQGTSCCSESRCGLDQIRSFGPRSTTWYAQTKKNKHAEHNLTFSTDSLFFMDGNGRSLGLV